MNRDTTDQVRALMTAGDRLDDIKRVRMWSKLEDRIELARVVGGGARTSMVRRAAIGVGVVLAVAAVFVIVLGSLRGTPQGKRGELTVAAASTLTQRIGPYARTALVGPARLQILGTPGDATAVRLDEGTLLAEFEGGQGRSLRIEARDLQIEIVGTLFAVEVRGAGACVAVAHGKVRVTSGGEVRFVTDREQLCSGEAAPHAIPKTIADALGHHDQRTVDLVPPDPGQRPTSTHESTSTAPSTSTIASTSTSTIAVEPTPAPRSASASSPSPSPSPSPTPLSASAPPPTPPPTPSADALYQLAESALSHGDLSAADAALARVLADPSSPLTDQALYERARIAYQQHRLPAARAHLAKLAALRSTPLAEQGMYLDCRIAAEAKSVDAETCLAGYRTEYPGSPHDLDLLAAIARLAFDRGGCTAATSARTELVRLYPTSDHATAWRARCPDAQEAKDLP